MDIIKKAEIFAKQEYLKNDPKHQWAHIESVMKRAMEIANKLTGVDYEALQLAVIFHDIDYHSESSFEGNYHNHVENSIKIAEKFLVEHGHPQEKITRVKTAMLDHSTPHRKKFGDSKIIEGKILFDADKSIFLNTQEKYDKYYQYLYFEETKKMV